MKQLLLVFVLSSFLNCLAQVNPTSCGVVDDSLPLALQERMRDLPSILQLQKARISTTNRNICRIAVEIDSDTYEYFERDTTQIWKVVLKNIALASLIFEKEINTQLVVTDIRIWKDVSKDPFRYSNSLYTLINKLATTPSATENFDKRVYLYTKNSADVAGIANIAGANNISPLFSVGTFLHELGHNFGSPHTHSCFWPGGPIDFCINIEGDCYNESLNLISNGTIMSYCREGNVGTQTFHPLCQAVMKGHAEQKLLKVTQAPDPIKNVIKSTISPGTFVVLPPSITADSYTVSYSPLEDFSNEIFLNTPDNGFIVPALEVGNEYYFRLRVQNSFGESTWSEASKVTVTPNPLNAPKIITNTGNTLLIDAFTTVSLDFTSIPNATQYEIVITQNSDIDFAYPFLKKTTNQPHFSYQVPNNYRCYRWRVRAVNGNVKSDWSSSSYIALNAKENDQLYFPFPNSKTNIPTTFPINYQAKSNYSKVTITVAANQNFENPVFISNRHGTNLIKNLSPNTPYYLKVEEINDNELLYPKGKITDFTMSFSTGSINIPENITFLADINSSAFSTTETNFAITENYAWINNKDVGLVKLNLSNLDYEINTRESTNGLYGFTSSSSIKAGKDSKLYIYNQGNYGQYRYFGLENEDITKPTPIFRFYDQITNFSPKPDLLWFIKVLYGIKNGSLIPLYAAPIDEYILDAVTWDNKAWILLNNNNTYNEIIILDLLTKTVSQRFNYTNTIEVKKSIQEIGVDNRGRFWLKQSDATTGLNSIGFYESGKWTIFNQNNAPFGNNLRSFSISSNGSVYLLSTGAETRVFKFNDSSNTWNVLDHKIPIQNFGSNIQVDKYENLWVTSFFGLVRMANCPPKPIISQIPETTIYDKKISLVAENCLGGQYWSWKNKEEEVRDSLLQASQVLDLNLKSTTTFTAKCAGISCKQNDTTFTVKVNPIISVVSLDKDSYCSGEDAVLKMTIQGEPTSTNNFTVSITKNDILLAAFENLTIQNSSIQLALPLSLLPGEYQIIVKDISTGKILEKVLPLIILEKPSLILNTDKTELIPFSESAAISISLTGSKPWEFTLWNNQKISTELDIFETNFVLNQTSDFKLFVKDLKDKNCFVNGEASAVTIKAGKVTANPVLPSDYKITVYPNPTTQQLNIELNHLIKDLELDLIDSKGGLLQQFRPDHLYNSFDIGKLSPGIYIISGEYNGQKLSWKISKN